MRNQIHVKKGHAHAQRLQITSCKGKKVVRIFIHSYLIPHNKANAFRLVMLKADCRQHNFDTQYTNHIFTKAYKHTSIDYYHVRRLVKLTHENANRISTGHTNIE